MTESFDPKQVKLITSIPVEGTLYAVCHDAKRNVLYGAGTDWAVYTVDLSAEKPTARRKWTHHENYVSSLVLVGSTIISGGYDRKLIWTDATSGKRIRSVDAHKGWVRDVIAFPDGKRLAGVGDDLIVRIWDVENGKRLGELDGHKKQTPQGFATAVYALAVSPDGKTLASGDRIGEVCLWDVESGKLKRRLEAPGFYTYDPLKRSRSIGGIRSLCFSPDGTKLALGGIGQVTNVDGFVGPCRVEVWDCATGNRVLVGQDKHKAVLNHVVYHPTESWLIAAGGGDGGGILAFWDLKKEAPSHKVKPKGHLQQIVFDADAGRLYAVGHGGFQIWAAST